MCLASFEAWADPTGDQAGSAHTVKAPALPIQLGREGSGLVQPQILCRAGPAHPIREGGIWTTVSDLVARREANSLTSSAVLRHLFRARLEVSRERRRDSNSPSSSALRGCRLRAGPVADSFSDLGVTERCSEDAKRAWRKSVCKSIQKFCARARTSPTFQHAVWASAGSELL